MSRRVLVTGGAGFLGSALVRRLVARGDAVRVLDDASRGSFERLADLEGRYEAVPADCRDTAAVTAAAADCDVLWHLAAVNGTSNFYERPQLVFDVALRGTLAAADAARAAGVRRLMIASSSEVYHLPDQVPTPEDVPLKIPDLSNPRYSYAGGKIVSELIARHGLSDSDVEVVVFRPHNVYGPCMGWEHVIPQFVQKLREAVEAEPATRALAAASGAEVLERAAAGGERPTVRLPIQGDGSETRAFCFVEEAIHGLELIAERGAAGETYHLGRNEETSIRELAQTTAQTLGLQVEIEPGPRPVGGPLLRCPDVSKLTALGDRESIELGEGLRRTVPWYWDHPRP